MQLHNRAKLSFPSSSSQSGKPEKIMMQKVYELIRFRDWIVLVPLIPGPHFIAVAQFSQLGGG
jgi:hypothetical protein